ncbi:glycosyltransferase [Amnibacterium flavum]|uniref:Uncharacterized protein n=2 Tax=Amnibacterium flavum TaxID=2173173 RepID=A0A2V1HTH1_9MICO|nr:glycosyltransferase [Amnibacterium flavum]PVZ95863.1 hypothetical protein DDQ50_05205 [Amnibacterium flavum]
MPSSSRESEPDLYFRGDAVPHGRDSFALPPGGHVTTDTYFGAFPAMLWRDHAASTRVRLSLETSGPGRVEVRVTDSAGQIHTVADTQVTTGPLNLDVEIGDFQWLWFEATAGPDTITVSAPRWSVEGAPRRAGQLALCVTTFDRVDDCARLLSDIAADEALMASVEQVFVVDQGTQDVRTGSGFPSASELLGERLTVIRQPNLGGSGGYSRGMLEALRTDARHAVLIDDDVVLEPESISRMSSFAAHAVDTTMVGAHMLDLRRPSLLHSWGERVDRDRAWWGPVQPELSPLDVAAATPGRRPELSRSLDVDFNGWWLCLIPLDLIRRVGLSLPFFIKWDDAEFGLRAADHGTRTVTLPGAALWHVPWTSKDNGLDWQVYYHVRNRLVVALLHGGRPLRVLAELAAQDANHLVCMQYGSVAVRQLALTDLLTGPHHLVDTIAVRRRDVLEILTRFGQAVVPGALETVRKGTTGIARGSALSVLLNQLVGRPPVTPPPVVAAADGKWHTLGRLDSAALETASGTGHFALRRSRRRALVMALRSLRLYLRLAVRWPALRRAYSHRAPALASAATWHRIFGSAGPTGGSPEVR